MIKQLVQRAFGAFGYQITANQFAGWTPECLARFGSPRTVVDVGVGFGTYPLYRAFPHAQHILIEPLSEFEASLKEIAARFGARYFLTAVGAQNGKATITINPDRPQMSSLNKRNTLAPTGAAWITRDVPVVTLDSLAIEHNLQPPFGLKIDTEGHELSVIQGASQFLRETEFVIAEVSVEKRFESSYTFTQFVSTMEREGFDFFDILSITRSSAPYGIKYIDSVFKKK